MPVSPEDAELLGGFFEAADQCRKDAEAKWGIGRLEIIAGRIDPPLLARFRGQQARWRAALSAAWGAEFISRDALALVEKLCGSMQRAWGALDTLAEEAGQRAIAPWVWEVRLSDGTIAAFVQTDAEAGKVIAEGRHLVVYTAQEVGNLIDLLPEAIQLAKAEWPGAKVQPPSPYRRTGGPIPWDDPIPFGDQQEDAA